MYILSALLFFLAALVVLLDFVFVFSCPFLNLISASGVRTGFARTFRFWGAFSIGVGILSVAIPIIAIGYYVQAAPDSLLRKDGFLSYFVAQKYVLAVLFPLLVLGYILRRFSRILESHRI